MEIEPATSQHLCNRQPIRYCVINFRWIEILDIYFFLRFIFSKQSSLKLFFLILPCTKSDKTSAKLFMSHGKLRQTQAQFHHRNCAPRGLPLTWVCVLICFRSIVNSTRQVQFQQTEKKSAQFPAQPWIRAANPPEL